VQRDTTGKLSQGWPRSDRSSNLGITQPAAQTSPALRPGSGNALVRDPYAGCCGRRRAARPVPIPSAPGMARNWRVEVPRGP
jgi:hypothetical protein